MHQPAGRRAGRPHGHRQEHRRDGVGQLGRSRPPGQGGPDRDRRPALRRLGTHRHRPDRAGGHAENAPGPPGPKVRLRHDVPGPARRPRERDRGLASIAAGGTAEAVFGGDVPARKPFGSKLTGAIVRTMKLGPGEEATRPFVITWHFPNLSLPGTRLPAELGRHYATRFASAADVARYLGKNWRGAAQGNQALARDLVRLDAPPLVPRPHVRQHVDPGDVDLPPLQERAVLRLGGRRLLRGHVHARLALRPGRGPALPRAGADPPGAGRLRRGHRLRPQDRHHQPSRRGAGRAGRGRPGREHPAGLSRAPDVGRRGVPEAALAARQGLAAST